ncbi:MAG: beta-1,3-glucanase family protein [Verrucomicrobiota bacterium]
MNKLFPALSLVLLGLAAGHQVYAQSSPPVVVDVLNERNEDVYIYFSGPSTMTGTILEAADIATANGSINNNTGVSTIVSSTGNAGANSNIAISTRAVVTNPDTTVSQNINSTGYRIGANSTLSFSISAFNSGRIGFSLGESVTDGTLSQFNNPNNVNNLGDYTKRYDKVELTVNTNGASSNLSAVDFTAVPFTYRTNDPSSAVQNAGWSGPYNQTVANIVNNAVTNTTPNAAGSALVTGPEGFNPPGTSVSNVVRVITPSTAVQGNNVPSYNSMEGAVDNAVGANIQLKNLDFGTGDTYDISGSITDSGGFAATFTGTYTPDGGSAQAITATLDADAFTDALIYGSPNNPAGWTFSGASVPVGIQNDITRDFYAGLNLGAWGSTEVITTTDPTLETALQNAPLPGGGTVDLLGQIIGELSSEELMALGEVAGAEFFFDYAQPGTPLAGEALYNEFAEEVALGSNNSVYGFAYSDFLGGQLITANPINVGNPTLTLTILGDAVPEPGTGALLLGGGLLVLLRRRRARA